MKPIETVSNKLHNVKKNGASWTACCPAHEDNQASLSIAEGTDGRVLLNCHAGCPVENAHALRLL